MGKYIKKADREAKRAVDQVKHTSRRIAPAVREGLIKAVAELYIKGYSYRKIQASVEQSNGELISLPTIGNYVKRLLEEWKTERVNAIDDLKTVELQRINKLENNYWEGWERSLEGSKRTTEKQRAKPGKAIGADGKMIESMNVEHAEKSNYTEETFGDPRFLAGIQWCISMRCKILGIEAPIEFKGTMTSEIKRTTVFKTRSRNRPD